MARVLALSGSPSAASLTQWVLRHVMHLLEQRGHEVELADARHLPPEALLGGDRAEPEIRLFVDRMAGADGIVVGSPVYNVAYSGLTKAALDVLPQHGLRGKSVLPVATGGSFAHVLAVDYALRPVLVSLGADHVGRGLFVCSESVERDGDRLCPDQRTERSMTRAVEEFSRSLTGRVTQWTT